MSTGKLEVAWGPLGPSRECHLAGVIHNACYVLSQCPTPRFPKDFASWRSPPPAPAVPWRLQQNEQRLLRHMLLAASAHTLEPDTRLSR
ncbi:hypothetical protein NDU88_001234 [Pleurodeles waltl]|uniref:Uncharacterized protein n=1 Tax=Pleurodeles waltl TaxID=8319 RepID=A0AAV7UU69_PLEWA|nr:hypothetical protein NDU88_001234 [Pleurodeles waltl]